MSPDPVTLEPGLRASAAFQRLRLEHFRHAPVVDGGVLVGMVTDRDLLRALPATIGQIDGSDDWDPTVSQIMSQELVTIGPNAHVEEAARTLLEHGIHGLPVVDEGQLVGILTDTDLFEVFARLFAKPAEHRLTLLSTPAERDPQSPDLVRTAVACGLEIASIFSQELPQGEIASEVAINGSSDAVKRYLARLAALGVTRIDSR